MTKLRNVRKLKEVLLDSKLTHKQIALTLYTVLKDPDAPVMIDTWRDVKNFNCYTDGHLSQY